jgi:hypothetical protein
VLITAPGRVFPSPGVECRTGAAPDRGSHLLDRCGSGYPDAMSSVPIEIPEATLVALTLDAARAGALFRMAAAMKLFALGRLYPVLPQSSLAFLALRSSRDSVSSASWPFSRSSRTSQTTWQMREIVSNTSPLSLPRSSCSATPKKRYPLCGVGCHGTLITQDPCELCFRNSSPLESGVASAALDCGNDCCIGLRVC